MASVKASEQGLVQIKQAMARRKWKWDSDRPLLEASKILEPKKQWDEPGSYATGCSRKSWKRFLQRIPIRPQSFHAFCQALGIDPDLVAQSDLKEDWGEAPDVPVFHGREPELATLEQWIVRDKQRLINIVGFAGIGKTNLVSGGIGKTDLSLQLARKVREDFEYLIWRRLLNAPSLATLLIELIEFVSDSRETELATTTDGLITQLLHYLKQRRCLLILDNVESILQIQDRTRNYRSGYEEYGNFFRRIGTSEHQSCVLLTTRVKPKDIEEIENIPSVRSLELGGLDTDSGRAIFTDIGRAYNTSLIGTDADWKTLISFYNGNPLALEVIARGIVKQYDGNLTKFLQQDLRVFGKIRDLLDWHFERLTADEKTVMYWLALNREAVSIADLQADIFAPLAKKLLPETLDNLERKIPIERTDRGYTLQPVLIEYMSDRAIAEVCQELKTGKLQLFNSHALIKASAKDYAKASQIRIILQPIIEQSIFELGETQRSLEDRLSEILLNLNRQRSGYAGGNLINLMRYAKINLAGYDFSNLTIWQADLQNLDLHGVNFTGCKFANCSLTQDFGGIYAIAFSPNRDVFAVGDSSGGIRLFRLEDRQPCLYLKGHLENTFVTSLAFSLDGKFLASTSMDYTVKLWDIQTGKCLKTLQGHQDWIWTVAFSPNGQTIASGGDDNTIRLWNIDTEDCRVLESDSGWVWGVAFNPEGNIIASAGYDSTIRLWSANTGKCLKILQGHGDAVWCVAFHPTDRILASGSADNTVKLWDLKTGDCVATLEGHTREVRSVAFGADGIVISGSFDRTTKLWDFSTGKCLKTLSGHTDGVRVAAIDSNRNILASGDSNQMLKLWDVNTGKCLKTWQGFANWIWTIALSPKGQLLASGSLDKTVKLWDLESGEEIAVLTGHHNWVWSVAFSPDGRILASSSDDESIKIWNVNTGKCLNTFHLQTNGGVWSVAFSPDGKLLASGSRDGGVRLWDLESEINTRCITGHSNYITNVTFSPDGKYIASCSGDRTIKLWSVETGECLTSIEDNLYKFMSLVFSPDGQMLVSGDELENLQLWDIQTGKCIQNFPGHTDTVWAIAFLNERTFASGSVDETIRLWDLDTGKCLKILTGHTGWVRAIAFTPEQTLVSSSTDGTIRQWDLDTGQTRKLLRSKKPYEEMKIADVQGLTIAQKETLIALGARESPVHLRKTKVPAGDRC